MTEQKRKGSPAFFHTQEQQGMCIHVHTHIHTVALKRLLFSLMLEIPSHLFLCFSVWPHPFGECSEGTGQGRGTRHRAESEKAAGSYCPSFGWERGDRVQGPLKLWLGAKSPNLEGSAGQSVARG